MIGVQESSWRSMEARANCWPVYCRCSRGGEDGAVAGLPRGRPASPLPGAARPGLCGVGACGVSSSAGPCRFGDAVPDEGAFRPDPGFCRPEGGLTPAPGGFNPAPPPGGALLAGLLVGRGCNGASSAGAGLAALSGGAFFTPVAGLFVPAAGFLPAGAAAFGAGAAAFGFHFTLTSAASENSLIFVLSNII